MHVKYSGVHSKKKTLLTGLSVHTLHQLQKTPQPNSHPRSRQPLTETPKVWFTITAEKAALVASYYKELVPWKPKFLSLRKNNSGHDFILTLKVNFGFMNRSQYSTYAMKTAMVMPHLLLARTKDANDGPIGKTLNRRKSQWLKANLKTTSTTPRLFICVRRKQ